MSAPRKRMKWRKGVNGALKGPLQQNLTARSTSWRASESQERAGGLYACAMCGDRFHRAKDLEDHIESHDDDEQCSMNRFYDPMSPEGFEYDDPMFGEDPLASVDESLPEEELKAFRSNLPDIIFEDILSDNTEDGESVSIRSTSTRSEDRNKESSSAPRAVKRRPQSQKPLYKCISCAATFTSAVLLKNHAVVHALDCPKCGETFLIKPSLDRHLREKHCQAGDSKDKTAQSYPQTLSSRSSSITFKKRKKLETPQTFASDVLIEATEDGQFRCKMCGKTVQNRSDMSKHVRRHTDERPFSCDICGERFKQQSAITNHVRIHTGERPFSCSYCGKQFSQPSNKRRHEALHRGEKPFQCSICLRNFSEKTTLQTHFLQHTGERPFVCVHCGRGHVTNSALKQHLLRRHRHEMTDEVASPDATTNEDEEESSSHHLRIKTEN